MCGIAGVLHRDGRPASVTSLKAMTDLIAHRGPDGEGHYCDGRLVWVIAGYRSLI